mmetsp:Transcript_19240/g.40882  ORF Transcript_19240/g.40882 Transcript_19240/m.40882 type:complete len:100 (+) Transcript_19240:982-1281(+)
MHEAALDCTIGAVKLREGLLQKKRPKYNIAFGIDPWMGKYWLPTLKALLGNREEVIYGHQSFTPPLKEAEAIGPTGITTGWVQKDLLKQCWTGAQYRQR